MKIGIVCYASVGGSGVVATELGHALARRGHQVHLISSEVPFRWRDGYAGLSFTRVEAPAYPLFREPQYLLPSPTRSCVSPAPSGSTSSTPTTPCRTPRRLIWPIKSSAPTPISAACGP